MFNDYALAALKGHPVYSKAKAAVDNVRVPYTKPALNEYNNVGLSKETFVCGNVKLAFDTVHGGLSFLEIDNKIWVDSTTSPGTSRFLSFSYSTYNESDYDQMHAACTAANNNGISCGYGGYDKPNDAQLKRHLSLFYNLYTFVNRTSHASFCLIFKCPQIAISIMDL